MASKSTWKGTIGFGLVSVPVKLYTATEDKDIHLNSIHRKCNTRIQMPKWCPTCNGKVEAAELVRGYDKGDGTYVLLEEADFAALPLKSLKSIDVLEFVDGAQIDPRFFEKSYILCPDEAGVKAFSLFLQAMAKTNMVGIAKVGLRDKEHLICVRAFGTVLLLQTLFWPDEVKGLSEFQQKLPDCSEREIQMAITLLGTLKSDTLVLGQYQDDYRDALMKVINAKIAGTPLTAQPVAAAPKVDLVDALMASIQAAENAKKATTPTLADQMKTLEATGVK